MPPGVENNKFVQTLIRKYFPFYASNFFSLYSVSRQLSTSTYYQPVMQCEFTMKFTALCARDSSLPSSSTACNARLQAFGGCCENLVDLLMQVVVRLSVQLV